MNNNILAILTSRVLYGKERANISVYNILQNKCNKKVHVVSNSKADTKLVEAMKGFVLHPIIAPSREIRNLRTLKYAIEYIIANIRLLSIILRVNPETIMMCNEVNFYDFYPALLLARKRILFRVGDAPAYESLSFRKYNEYVWKQFVVKKVKRIVCNAKYVQNTVTAAGRDPINDRIIYNYPPARVTTSRDESTLYNFDREDKPAISFGFIGQINKPKGVQHLVEAGLRLLEEKKNIRLIIAGSLAYDETFSKEVRSIIPMCYRDKILFIGEIEDIDLFFKHIDVLCIPSIKQEPLANVLSEAKYHHCASIVYPSGGLPELITHSVDGYICKDSTIDSLYEAISFYISNPDTVNSQGEAAYSSTTKYGIDKESFERKWIEAYTSL